MPNSPEQKKDIFDLSEQEFKKYFQTKILPNLQDLYKKHLDNKAKPIVPLFLKSPWFILVIIMLCCLAIYKGLWVYLPLIMISVLFIFLASTFPNMIDSSIASVGEKVKEKIMPMLGFKWIRISTYLNGTNNEEIRKKRMEYRIIFNRIIQKAFFLVPHQDEVITGRYNGQSFVLLDFYTESKGRFNNIPDATYYKVLLCTKINKSFKNDIFINKSKNFNLRNKLYEKAIKLEDLEFSKEYDVYCNNQVEVRYILTSAFMERLLSYKLRTKRNLEMCFSTKFHKYYNVFICLDMEKDMFEFSEDALDDMGKFSRDIYGILQEIKDIMDIVEALKLDQDIGL